MKSERQTSPFFLLPSLALLLILTGKVIWQELPKSIRPVGKKSPIEIPEIIDCRLWQDPYEVALNDIHQRESKSSDSNWLTDFQVQSITPPKSGTTKVMFVMLRHRFTAEDSERRLRTRYAVLTALNNADYAPVDSEHIQYAIFQPDTTNTDPNQCCEPSYSESIELGMHLNTAEEKKYSLKIQAEKTFANQPKDAITKQTVILPFEWYRLDRLEGREGKLHDKNAPGQNSKKTENILLMWLPENGFKENPFNQLITLIDSLKNITQRSNEFLFIGPTSSDILLSMYRQIQKISSLDVNPNYTLNIYSPWSTVSSTYLPDILSDTEKDPDINDYYWEKDLAIKDCPPDSHQFQTNDRI